MMALDIILAFALDLAIGDPAYLPHPVRAIGKAAEALERLLLRPGRRPAHDRAMGVLLALSVPLAVFFVSYYAVLLAGTALGSLSARALTVYLAYTTISAKGLADAAREVVYPLKAGDIEGARRALSAIVGRDTGGLDEDGVARGAVETVAENTSDGVVAPLFYLALGGAPLALAYKAVNTLDSMVGYRSEKYRYFGWAAARADDLANFIPARLTGLLMAAASYVLGGVYSWEDSLRILKRDRKNHPSPNSGHPEAAAAGALRVRLGGESSYSGVASVKPFIGDPEEPLTAGKIGDAVRLMYAAAFLAAGLAALLAYVIEG